MKIEIHVCDVCRAPIDDKMRFAEDGGEYCVECYCNRHPTVLSMNYPNMPEEEVRRNVFSLRNPELRKPRR